MGEFWFRGPGARDWVSSLTTNDVAKLEVGQAQYNLMCVESGGIVDDVIVYRTDNEEYLMVVNAANVAKDAAHVSRALPASVRFEDASPRTALVAVQGPRASVVVMAVTNLPVREESIEALPAFEHAFTHYRLTMHPLRLRVRGAAHGVQAPERTWMSSEQAAAAALPTPIKRIIAMHCRRAA